MVEQIKVLSTLAVELALKSRLLPTWLAAGHDIEMEWNPTGVLVEQVKQGARGDVLIAIDQSMEDLLRQDIIDRNTVRPLARAAFGLGTREGQPLPDISTSEHFRQTLLQARSIAYSLTGASGIHFQNVISRLGIADEVKSKATIIQAGFTADRVISGEADLAVQQISELMAIEGIDVVGPFPGEFQKTTEFSAAIFTQAAHPRLAARFIEHLTNENAAQAYARCGLSPRIPIPA